GDGGRVGVHLDGGGLAAAAGITPAGQIDKGLLAPAGFVEIIGILADRAVIGDKAFAVAPFGGGHRPVGAAEVKHIPHKAAPHKVPGLDLGIGRFVPAALEFLGAVAGLGVIPVEGNQAVCAVLGQAEGHVGIFLVEAVKEGAVVGGFT